MATAYYTPGVYIEEVDKGTKPIQGVSTSVTAFIGFTVRAERTQEDGRTTRSILGEPTLVTNWGQYERMFGGFHKDAYLPYAVRGFFDNGGTRCYVVSIRAMDAHRAQLMLYGEDPRTHKKVPVLFVRAAKAGGDGNDYTISIEALDNKTEPTEKELRLKRYKLTVSRSGPAVELREQVDSLKAQWEEAKATVANLQAEQGKEHSADEKATLKQALDEANKEQQAIKTALDAAQKTLKESEAAKGQGGAAAAQSLEFNLDGLPCLDDERAERQKYAYEQRSRNGAGTSTGNGAPKGKPSPLAGTYSQQRAQSLDVEVWKLNKSGAEAAIGPDAVKDKRLKNGGWQFDNEFLNTLLEDAGLPAAPVNGEADQAKIVIDNSLMLYRGREPQRKGLDGLFAFDEINLVCAPDLMRAYEVLGPEGRADADAIVKGVQEAILNFCQRAHYPFAILDSPPNKDVQAIYDWRMALPGADTAHGALYYPWIKITDPFDAKRQIEIPPCGHIAGIYARSDTQRGVHKAPANEPVGGAVDLPLNVTKNEQELLNPVGINCIRAFPGRGIRIWGARTLAMTDPAWRYINVRRLFSYVEASIERSTQWIVFEPNDYVLWGKVRRDVSAFLRTVWLSGALFGLTPEQAFYVKCDEETNLPELRDLGQMVCEIGMAPVKPAEFVIFRFSQWTSDADTGG